MATLCVGPTSTGSGSGADWSNMMAKPNGTGWVRGNTYYIADGSYSAFYGSTAPSGSTLITVKKATVADHGPSTGWSDTLGDGQAIFTSTGVSSIAVQFDSSYWVFDGQTRDESQTPQYRGWDNEAAYGFAAYISGTGAANINNAICVAFRQGDGNITVSNTACYFDGIDRTYEGTFTLCVDGYEGDSITLSKCLFRNPSWKGGFQLVAVSNLTIERCCFDQIGKKEGVGSLYGSTNITIQYNWFRDVGGTGLWVCFQGVTSGSIGSFHGNLCEWGSDTYFALSDCLVGVRSGYGEQVNGWTVVNNTFVRTRGSSLIGGGTGSIGNVARNNLFLDGDGSYTATTTTSNNVNTTDDSIFNDTTIGAGDYRLSADTAAGTTLSSPYDVDMFGVTRGSSGNWSIGAFQYTTGEPTDPGAGKRTCGFMLTPVYS